MNGSWQPSLNTMIAAVVASMLGMGIHNALELGPVSLLNLASGFLPMLVIEGALVAIWWQAPDSRRIVCIALLGIGLLQMIGGGLISGLPLDVLPFDPI